MPGNRPELAEKAGRSGASVVVLDLEDAVPPDGKAEARELVREAALALRGVTPVAVRVNPPGTAWYDDDVAALPEGLLAVVVPKLESAAQLDEVGAGHRRSIGGGGIGDGAGGGRCPPGPASPGHRLLLRGRGLCGRPRGSAHRGQRGGGVGQGLGGRVRPAGRRGRARHGHVALRRCRSLRRGRPHAARALGYAGKLCIHPAQVPLANRAFGPEPGEVAWAERVLAAFEEAGGATIGFEGAMVDEVVAARARAILASVVEGR